MAQEYTYADVPSKRKAKVGLAPKKNVVIVLIALVLICGTIACIAFFNKSSVHVERAQEKTETATSSSEGDSYQTSKGASKASATTVCVDIDGAVATPGVYSFNQEKVRLSDVVKAAGGLKSNADSTQINLAALLSDGMKIHIPKVGEVVNASASGGALESSGTTGSGSENGSTLININTASEEDLTKLSGVGESTAKAIVKDREANGNFTKKEDLMRVSGIGEKKFAKIEDEICV